MIDTLIDKQDTSEIIRDKIAQILADESANQQALAVAAGKDPALWKLRVYTERATPWDDYKVGDVIVNVWYNRANVDTAASNVVERQTHEGVFNIDVLGFGSNSQASTGDELAAKEAQRGMRLVRNVLMSSIYTYLDLRPTVGRRMPEGIESFQPTLANRATTHVVGMRLALGVRYSEYSPQYTPDDLQYAAVTIERAEDGSVIAQVDFDYTA